MVRVCGFWKENKGILNGKRNEMTIDSIQINASIQTFQEHQKAHSFYNWEEVRKYCVVIRSVKVHFIVETGFEMVIISQLKSENQSVIEIIISWMKEFQHFIYQKIFGC